MKFLDGSEYTHLCPRCRALITAFAQVMEEGGEDTDNEEAPADYVYDTQSYCGGHTCIGVGWPYRYNGEEYRSYHNVRCEVLAQDKSGNAKVRFERDLGEKTVRYADLIPNIMKGRRVIINHPRLGSIKAKVLTAANNADSGGPQNWYLEIEAEPNGRYLYWKQIPDGGSVFLLD